MASIKLSKANIEKLAAPHPSGKQTLFWAEGNATPGLGILVSGTTASKSWVAQGNLPGGKTRRITLGSVAVLSAEEAWTLARPKLAEMLSGRDPKKSIAEKALAAQTVEDIYKAYLKASPNLSPASISLYGYALTNLGPLKTRTMRELTPDEIEQRFDQIRAEVMARRTKGNRGGVAVNGKATANITMRLLGILWAFQAERDPGLPGNPIATRRFKRQWHSLERRKRHVPSERLADFYNATLKLENDILRDLVLVGLFSGMREGEVQGLMWSEVDLPNKMLHLPASRMKNKKDFDLPMSDVIHAVLVARRASGLQSDYVFPGWKEGSHSKGYLYALQQIGASIQLKLSPHDLRRSFLNVVETAEVSPLAHKMLVSHSTGNDVTSGYKLLSLTDFRSATQKVADRMKLLCGIEDMSEPNVVRLSA